MNKISNSLDNKDILNYLNQKFNNKKPTIKYNYE